MSFLDSFDWSSLSDLFGGNAPDLSQAAQGAAPSFDYGSLGNAAANAVPDLGQFAWDSAGGGGIGGANPATFQPGGHPPALNTSGYSPGAATIGGEAPGQAAPAPGSPFGGETDPEQFARQGADKITSGPIQTGSGQPPAQQPPPTAWESAKNAPAKWWQSANNEFDRNPIGTTAKVGAMAAPFVGAGINAAMQPKAPGKYTLNPPAPQQPASAVRGSDTIPAASPMSTMLTGQGGFKVQPQGFAEGGKVSDQDERDYQEAMRGTKPAQQPASKPKSAYDQQLDEADKGKQQKPSSYFKRGN